MNPCLGGRRPPLAAVVAPAVAAATEAEAEAEATAAAAAVAAAAGTSEARAILLSHCGRWRGPPGTARIAGAGPASICVSRSKSSYNIHKAVIFLLISCWTCLSTAAAVATSASASISIISPDRSPRLIPGETETALDTTTTIDPTRETVTVTVTRPETATAETKEKARTEAEPETLLIDTRIPVFLDGHWRIMSDEEHRELRRREAAPKETSPPTTITTEIVINPSTVTDTDTDPDAAASTTTAAASPLPSPFDGALASNFSTGHTCPAFITEFLSNATFKACYPVSLLLQSSHSFFEAEKSFFSITQVLDAACKADVAMCTDYFNDLAKSLISDKNCGKEYKLQNALVVQAYRGMKVYETVYRATCLTDADSNSSRYCFANAVTNTSTPSNAYLYYLPFNSTLPVTAAPACGSCTRQTMEIYQAATSNRKADIVNTYQSAAEQINSECGNSFVNTSLAAVVQTSAATTLYPTSSSSLLLLSFIFMAISRWIL